MFENGPGDDILFYRGAQNDGTLFVFFSSYQMDWKSNVYPNRFDFTKTAITLDRPAMLLRDRENLWYQTGIDGAPEGPEAVAEAVALEGRNYDRIVTIGSSMGGYAALFVGNYVKAEMAVGIVPQLRIGRRASFHLGETRFADEFTRLDEMGDRWRAYKLDERIARRPWFTRYVMIVGEKAWIDVEHAKMLWGENIEMVTVPGADHNDTARTCLTTRLLDPIWDRSYLSGTPLIGMEPPPA